MRVAAQRRRREQRFQAAIVCQNDILDSVGVGIQYTVSDVRITSISSIDLAEERALGRVPRDV
jgi:hypothetical protein